MPKEITPFCLEQMLKKLEESGNKEASGKALFS